MTLTLPATRSLPPLCGTYTLFIEMARPVTLSKLSFNHPPIATEDTWEGEGVFIRVRKSGRPNQRRNRRHTAGQGANRKQFEPFWRAIKQQGRIHRVMELDWHDHNASTCSALRAIVGRLFSDCREHDTAWWLKAANQGKNRFWRTTTLSKARLNL